MGALFSRVKTWVSTEDVTYSDLNAEFNNILDNLTLANVDDYSANVSQMQTTADPGEVGTESLATTGAGEIARLRHLIREITGEDKWYETPTSSLLGLANAIGTGLTANRLVSGRVRSSGTNEMPIFLVPNGAARTVTVKGTTTNFIYYVNGTEYTISTDVNLTGLTAAPTSNNTCLINDAQAADDTYTKHTGEDGSIIPIDTAGSEITALVGKYAAFKLGGTTDEYFIAYVESSTQLSKAYRGFFFDSSDAPISRAGYTNNDTITLMKLTWVFAKTDGTLTATYTNPVWAKDEPTSPALGDYWFDLANNTWKVYGVGSYASAGAHLIGVCIQDGTNTVGARSFEFFANYADTNTLELVYDSATQVKSRHMGSVVNVWGQTAKSDRGLRTWDITLDRDSGVSESASTYYYAYLTQVGDVVISDVKPFDRREDFRGYYHPFASWRCVGSFFNNGSSNIDSAQVNSYFTRQDETRLIDATAAYHVEVVDKFIRFSGTSAVEYLPPAAKMRGQSLILMHNGTSFSQVYTLTAFGSETFNTNAATTYKLNNNGETLRIVSDGAGWYVLDHKAETQWADNGVLVFTATTSDPTKATGTNVDKQWYKRRGTDLLVRGEYSQSNTTSAAAGSGDYLVTIPLASTLTPDTNYITAYATAEGAGAWDGRDSIGAGKIAISTSAAMMNVELYNTTKVRFYYADANSAGAVGSSNYAINATSFNMQYFYAIPITGWEP